MHTYQYEQPCRAVALALGDRMAAISMDPFMSKQAAIHLVRIAENPADSSSEAILTIPGANKRINRVSFSQCNEQLITAGEDGYLRLWDVEVRWPQLTQPNRAKKGLLLAGFKWH